MPNILLTNRCNLNCPYCFAKEEMKDAGKKKEKDKLSFRDLKFILDFLEKSGEKTTRLMGGEPTLHSQFGKFVNYILSRNFKIHIFTNGLFSRQISDFLATKKDRIRHSFNINPPSMYSSRSWRQLLRNLKTITQFKNCLIGSVIWRKDFQLDYLIKLAKEYSVKVIMLRLANPIIGEGNIFIPQGQCSALAENIIREVKKINQNKIKVGFGCGLAGKMFTERQLQILRECDIMDMKLGCEGNTGRFDIAPDLNVFRCFPLFNWRRKKLSDFDNCQKAENYFTQLMQTRQSNNSRNDFIHQGPCFAYSLSRKNVRSFSINKMI